MSGTSIALGGRLVVDHLETYTSVNIFFLKAVIVFFGYFPLHWGLYA